MVAGIGLSCRRVLILITGTVVFAAGAVALLGWALDNPILKSFSPSFVSMKANTAAAFLLSGIALFLKADSRKHSRIADICAAVVALIGFLTLCVYLLGIDLRIDQLLFREAPEAVFTSSPGRMAPGTATAFLFAGLGMLSLDTRIRGVRPAEPLFLFVGLIGYLAIIGYIFNVDAMKGIAGFTLMALPTALAFIALSTGGLAARVEKGILTVLVSGDGAGVAARFLFPVAIVVPAALRQAFIQAQERGSLDANAAIALFVGSISILFCGCIFWCVHGIRRAEDRRLSAEVALRESEVRTAERKIAAEELAESRAKLAAAIESMTDAVFISDAQGRFIVFNEAFATFHKFKNKEACAVTFDEYPGFLEVFMANGEPAPVDQWAVPRALRGETATNAVYTLRRKDTGETWIGSYNFAPVRDRNGAIAGAVVAGRDITEITKLEIKARDAELRYRTLFEKSPYGILLVDPASTIPADFNETVHRQLGYSREEFSKLRVQDYEVREDPGETARRIDMIAREGWAAFETKHRAKNGELRDVYVTVQMIKISAGDFMVCRYQDITERKKSEEELVRLSAELLRKNRELEQVVYVASHDLRSPLVNVQGFARELGYSMEELAGLLNGDGAPPDIREKTARIIGDDVPEAMKYILAGISRMDSLLSGLLKLSRTGRAALNIVKLDMKNIIDDVVSAYEFQNKESGARVEAGDLPPCRGDAVQMGQVFSNLVGNALKYLDPARPGVIRISGEKRDGVAVYCVEDNGIGIAPEHQEIVFEIFHRLNPDSCEGEGLGLTIVRTILDRHNGEIRLESVPGKGSRVFVSLPGA